MSYIFCDSRQAPDRVQWRALVKIVTDISSDSITAKNFLTG